MPRLHEAYERYHPEGLEIVSVSVDENPRDVAAFRAETWPMPWQHLWLADGWQSEAMEAFEVSGIPRAILIDASGTILAAGPDLRQENLSKTLEMIFDNRRY